MTVVQPEHIAVYFPVDKRYDHFKNGSRAFCLFLDNQKQVFPAHRYSVTLEEYRRNNQKILSEKAFSKDNEIQAMIEKKDSMYFFYGTMSDEILLRELDDDTVRSYGVTSALEAVNMGMILRSYGEMFNLNFEQDDNLDMALNFFQNYQKLVSEEKKRHAALITA